MYLSMRCSSLYGVNRPIAVASNTRSINVGFALAEIFCNSGNRQNPEIIFLIQTSLTSPGLFLRSNCTASATLKLIPKAAISVSWATNGRRFSHSFNFANSETFCSWLPFSSASCEVVFNCWISWCWYPFSGQSFNFLRLICNCLFTRAWRVSHSLSFASNETLSA